MLGERTAIIIGGGPAGLSTALRLHQRTNVSCTIYELRPTPTTIGGAIGIQPNGMRLLERLGLHDSFQSLGSNHSKLVIRSLRGRVLWQQDFAGSAREKTGSQYMRIKRPELLDVLLEAARQAEIPVRYSKRLAAIEDTEDGVTVTFSDGTTDKADFLLGCDGIHSRVRQLYVNPLLSPEYSGFAGLSSFVSMSDLTKPVASQARGVDAMLTQEGAFLVMTCTKSDDELYWGFTGEVPLPESGDTRDGWEVYTKAEVEKSKSKLHRLLQNSTGDWGDLMKEIVDKTSVIKIYPLYKLPIGGTWFRGRCLLLGDAAHAMPPQAGQGTSMALEDAFLLSRLMEDPTRLLEDIYNRFDQIRRPRVDEVAKLAARNADIAKISSPWGLWLRGIGLWMFMWVSWAFGLDSWGVSENNLGYDIDEEKL